jgi:hypothetical protein
VNSTIKENKNMADIRSEKVITRFDITVTPDEYRIILSALDEYLDCLNKEMEESLNEDSDIHFNVDEKYIEKVNDLYEVFENAIDGQPTT